MAEDRMGHLLIQMLNAKRAREEKETAKQHQIETALLERLERKHRMERIYPDASPGSGIFGVPALVCHYCKQDLDPDECNWGQLHEKGYRDAAHFVGFAHFSCHNGVSE